MNEADSAWRELRRPDLTAEEREAYETQRWLGEGDGMARKLVQFRGNVEIPEGQEIGLGWTASFKGEGEFTGDSETLKRLEKGEVKITDTLTLTINPDKTTLASIQAPQGPLDEAIVGED